MRGYLVITNGCNYVEYRDGLRAHCFDTDSRGMFAGYIDLYAKNSDGERDIAGICDSLAEIEHDADAVREAAGFDCVALHDYIDRKGRACKIDNSGNVYYPFSVNA